MNIASIQIGENTLEVPGKWIENNIASVPLVTVNSSLSVGSHTFDLSQYLPNDDYVYEVEFDIHGSCGDSCLGQLQLPNSKGIARLWISHRDWVATNFRANIDTNRTMTIVIGNSNLTNMGFFITKYRKLYKDNSNE